MTQAATRNNAFVEPCIRDREKANQEADMWASSEQAYEAKRQERRRLTNAELATLTSRRPGVRKEAPGRPARPKSFARKLTGTGEDTGADESEAKGKELGWSTCR